MPDLAELAPANDPRIASVRSVLLWVQRAKRATSNVAATTAISIARRLRLPIVAGFWLVPTYASATLRPHHFVAEGLRELPDEFARHGIG